MSLPKAPWGLTQCSARAGSPRSAALPALYMNFQYPSFLLFDFYILVTKYFPVCVASCDVAKSLVYCMVVHETVPFKPGTAETENVKDVCVCVSVILCLGHPV